MANRFKIPSFLFFCCAVFVCLPGKAAAEEKARRVGIIFEGSFESPDISKKPPGGESTLMVPFYEWDYGIRSFSTEEWEKRELTWDRSLELSRSLGDQIMEEVEPELIRDDRGVVQYAILAAKEPFLSTAAFSDQFRVKFEETMGKSLYLVFIDRYVIYVFPAVGGTLEDYGPALVDEFQSTPLPVSLEVFFLNDDGLRVIGELSRNATPE
ncbi:MAG: hypothetical protein P1U81_09060 [Verrucomicrobiales bacterium]|jgi:hypothetical protein|nr:hypothetical protein [Verrucomicrobiales bacterium]